MGRRRRRRTRWLLPALRRNGAVCTARALCHHLQVCRHRPVSCFTRQVAGLRRRRREAVQTVDTTTTTRVSAGAPGPPAELALGRYRLIRRLGAGAFGVVWLAHDEQLDRVVAVKRIEVHDEHVAARAEREARAAARLSHPAIVALLRGAPRRGRRLPRLRARPRAARSAISARPARCPTATCCGSASRCATPSSTRTRAASCTATSSRPTSSSPTRPAGRGRAREAHRLRRRHASPATTR